MKIYYTIIVCMFCVENHEYVILCTALLEINYTHQQKETARWRCCRNYFHFVLSISLNVLNIFIAKG